MCEPAGQPSLDNDIGFLLKQFTLRRIEGFMNLVGQETHLLNGHSTCGTEITKTLTGVDPLPAGKQGNHGIGKRAFAGGNLARYGYGSNRQLSAPLSTGEGRVDLHVLYPINPNIANPTRPAHTDMLVPLAERAMFRLPYTHEQHTSKSYRHHHRGEPETGYWHGHLPGAGCRCLRYLLHALERL